MILLFYHLQQKILIVYLLGHIWIGFSIAFFLSSHLLKDEFSVIFIVGIKENRPWQVNTIAVCSSSTVLPTRGGGVLVFLCLPEISKYICFTTRIPSIQIQSNNKKMVDRIWFQVSKLLRDCVPLFQVMMFSASEVASYIAMVGVLSVVAQVRFLFLSVVQLQKGITVFVGFWLSECMF